MDLAEQEAAICSDYRAGVGINALARIYHRGTRTVMSILHAHGLVRSAGKGRGPKPPRAEKPCSHTTIHQCETFKRPCVIRSVDNCPVCKAEHSIENYSGCGATNTWDAEIAGAGR